MAIAISPPPKRSRRQLTTANYPDPERITNNFRDLLLQLGLPCFQDYLTIRLAPGLHQEDYHYLQRILGRHTLPAQNKSLLVDLQPVIRLVDFDGSRLFHFQTISLELLLHQYGPQLLRERREVSYMTGPDSHRSDDASLPGFLRTAYGAKVPARHLEVGIALFTKILPWHGIRTSMSCTGHVSADSITAPRIYLFGQYHLAYLRHILTESFSEYSIAKTWSFTYTPAGTSSKKMGFDPNWATGCFQVHPDWPDASIQSRHAYGRVVEDLHLIAKRMLDPNLAEYYRSRKNDWALDYHKRFVDPIPEESTSVLHQAAAG